MVGTGETLPFWEVCFMEQPFFLTQKGTAEHEALWMEGEHEGGGGIGGGEEGSEGRQG